MEEIDQLPSAYWIDGRSLHQSDQLEIGRYRQRDSKKAHTDRNRGVVTCRFPKIEGSRGFLGEQRPKHWAELCQDLRTRGNSHTGSDAGLRSLLRLL